MKRYDVAMVVNLGSPTGRTLRELAAQARAGYSSALMPVNGGGVAGRGFHHGLTDALCSGYADLVLPDQAIAAQLCVVHDGHLGPGAVPTPATVRAEKTLRVVSSAGVSTADDRRLDHAIVDDYLVAPTDEATRQALVAVVDPRRMLGQDWPDPIDVDFWDVRRRSIGSGTTTIGRHSGASSVHNWPATSEEILAAYPQDAGVNVRVLGDGQVARSVLGYTPSNWTLIDRDVIHPRHFLRDLDLYVYLCQAAAIGPAQRRMLEAMASGLVVIAPPEAELVFQGACHYATPAGAADLISSLCGDGNLNELGRESQQFVRETYGFDAHAARLQELIGPPRAQQPRSFSRSSGDRRPLRVAFFTSNGEGMGHLTRLMACARRLPGDFEPVFFTLSSAMAVVEEAGYPCEFIPRPAQWSAREWNPFLYRRLLELVDDYDVSGLVFDGISPYWGLIKAMSNLELPFVWMRRGMWKEGVGARSLEHASAFQMVIEPGDYAESVDRGLTAGRRHETLHVGPITLLDRSELLDRERAIEELDLDASKTRVLVLLGSDSLNDVASRAAIITHELLRHETVEVVFADWLISSRSVELPERVKRRAVYPVSRYLAAFDFAVSAAGYNSYHELLQAGVPTIFTPTRKLRDDQTARAAYAQRDGAAMVLHEVTQSAAARYVDAMMDEDCRAAMSTRVRDAYPPNGAQAAADAIAALMHRDRGASPHRLGPQGGGPLTQA